MRLKDDLRKVLEWLKRDSPPVLAPIAFSAVLIHNGAEYPAHGQMITSPLGFVGILYFDDGAPAVELRQSYDMTMDDGSPYLVKLEHVTENGGYVFQTSLPGGIDAAVTYGIG